MVSKTVTVINEQGLHMRPAGILAKAVAAHKDCKVTLHANGKTIAAKAVMQIMAACMKKGCEVEIVRFSMEKLVSFFSAFSFRLKLALNRSACAATAFVRS